MYRLSSIVLILFGIIQLNAQSPHGETLETDCAVCHNPATWSIAIDTFHYDHSNANFILEGVHFEVDCKECHLSLIFDEAPSQCVTCHNDMHSMSVGDDCVRCHTPQSWLVDDIPELHEENGFPLVGAHNSLSCVDCHIDETNLRFDRIGNDCINCHNDDYLNTQNPNHQEVGYSAQNCDGCHDPFSEGWNAGYINHYFFPLTLGHDIQDCQECHFTEKYSDTSPDCFSCHQDDFANTTNPNHSAGGFPMDCALCHTTEPGWQATAFQDHDDQYFPIYSGKHNGEWSLCVDCHTDSGNFSSFSCIDCHEHNNKSEVDDDHDDENGYVYESNACYECHPKGEE